MALLAVMLLTPDPRAWMTLVLVTATPTRACSDPCAPLKRPPPGGFFRRDARMVRTRRIR
jgi:hypothetical protein